EYRLREADRGPGGDAGLSGDGRAPAASGRRSRDRHPRAARSGGGRSPEPARRLAWVCPSAGQVPIPDSIVRTREVLLCFLPSLLVGEGTPTAGRKDGG